MSHFVAVFSGFFNMDCFSSSRSKHNKLQHLWKFAGYAYLIYYVSPYFKPFNFHCDTRKKTTNIVAHVLECWWFYGYSYKKKTNAQIYHSWICAVPNQWKFIWEMGANRQWTPLWTEHDTFIPHMLRIGVVALTILLTTIDGLINKFWIRSFCFCFFCFGSLAQPENPLLAHANCSISNKCRLLFRKLFDAIHIKWIENKCLSKMYDFSWKWNRGVGGKWNCGSGL